MSHGILIHETHDDVGVAVHDLRTGEKVGIVTLEGQEAGLLKVINDVPLGHKVAIRAMKVGHKLLKYGRPIGQVVEPIKKGGHVHTHNLKTTRWSLDEVAAPEIVTKPAERLSLGGRKPEEMKLLGYRRENGRFGIRNHVVILPVDDISNAAAEGVSYLIHGTMALPHPYGRLQFGEDLELTFRTLAGTGRNPNVAACIVIGIEPSGRNASWMRSPRPANR